MSGVVAVVIVSCLCVNVLLVLHLIETIEWSGCCFYCELFVCQGADCVAFNRS